MECIAYKAGYKYQLKEDCVTRIDLLPDNNVVTQFLELTTEGVLTMRKGYAWDGPSGPTFDTLNFMRGSLVHDALYQLMRERYLDEDTYRDRSDRLLQKICKEDGMSMLRAWWVYQGVHLFGKPSADPANDRPLTRAPKECQ
jgi:hypothetical protein